MNPAKNTPSKPQVISALAYPLTFLLLYFALVVHLRLGLGRWPVHISDNPTTSLFHAHSILASLLFYPGVVFATLAGLLAIILAFNRRTRRVAVSLAIFFVGCLLSFAAMHLAPSRFISWWWD